MFKIYVKKERCFLEQKGSIYIIRNNINDKVYVGQTTRTVEERFKNHLKPSVCKQRGTYKLYNAINKYGKENFYVEMLESNIPVNELDDKEIYYIEYFDSCDNGYNTTYGGNVRRIYKWEDIDRIISLFQNGVKAEEIAKEYKVCKGTIFRVIHGSGFYVNGDPSECTKEKLAALVKQGYTNQEIADILQMKPWTVQRRLQKYGIKRRRTYINNREDFDYSGVISDYLNGMKSKDICSKYEINPKTFQKIKDDYLNNNQ